MTEYSSDVFELHAFACEQTMSHCQSKFSSDEFTLSSFWLPECIIGLGNHAENAVFLWYQREGYLR